ncbi:mobile mystery protein B [Nocardioides albidus]|uniref:mobile mystery protein B n=1 Tax=Nocardioides albidus TaxID=1517589 RepID=UPI0013052752|nr:mobile mystery protein B [Nocardioides albidus]
MSETGGPFDPLNQPYGATPVNEDDREFLLPPHQQIETMAELNALEAANIARGMLWVREQGFAWTDLVDQYTLREVHREMFGDVWAWAGKIRQRETTVGIDPAYIQGDWKARLDDAEFHINARTWSPVETVLRLHHQTVAIHPFVNGNGRFARLAADELLAALGLHPDPLDWGVHLARTKEQRRTAYLEALRALDMNRNNVDGLVTFALDPNAVDEWPSSLPS